MANRQEPHSKFVGAQDCTPALHSLISIEAAAGFPGPQALTPGLKNLAPPMAGIYRRALSS